MNGIGAGPFAWWPRCARVQSRWLGALVERLVCASGGRCADVDGLRVCAEGRLRLHAKGGTQLGEVLVLPHGRGRPSPGLCAHERHHRDAQWRRYGWAFAVMYAVAEVWDVRIGRKCCNRYEYAAEVASGGGGGYRCPGAERP